MLTSPLFWYGKLPNQPEFLSANTDTSLQKLLQTWITAGQNHVGQALMGRSSATTLYAYGFLLQHDTPAPKMGLFLTSHDSVGRNFPFILVQNINMPVELFSQQIQDFFIQQRFDFTQFYPTFDSTGFFTQLQDTLTELQAIHTYHAQNHMDYWIECYPNTAHFKLTTEKLTPILYRKLMLRGNL